ncbi:MAG: chloride channel protein [Dehalococcoidales bacterium]|nr:chloride channel protein [Dehalococcoidales bacterium]
MCRFKFNRTAIREQFNFANAGYLRKWLTISILVGVVSGFASILFYLAIQYCTKYFLGWGAGYFPPASGGEVAQVVASGPLRIWAIPIITTLGGLVSGLIVYKWAPEAEGHGTDAAINAFHNKNGFIRRRVPVIKIIASAITIGSGGSAGREGPVALVGAGFGSAIADIFKLDDRDRRIALAIGIGAGIGSIFKSPLGGALLSIAILYRRDFEVYALLPSFIASIVGYTIFASWAGWTPIFVIEPTLVYQRPQELLGYIVLGVACGVFGTLYGRSFYWIRDLFRKLRIPVYLKPALGGLLVGGIAIFLPQVMGSGYGWMQYAIDGNYAALPILVMVALIFAKIAATGFSIGSGGSGGVFAPGLFIGSMVGGLVWYALHLYPSITPFIPSTPAAFVIVGMMGLFGGIAKAPLPIMIMVSEMTGSYFLLAPCMVTVFITYFMTRGSYIYI